MNAEGRIGMQGDKKGDHDFIAAHKKAIRAFYEEIGLELPKTAP